jgi:hypothetical protein
MSSYFGWLVGALTSVPGNVGECTGSLTTCDSLRNDGARLKAAGPSGVGIGFAADNITGALRVDTLRRGAEASGVGSNSSRRGSVCRAYRPRCHRHLQALAPAHIPPRKA